MGSALLCVHLGPLGQVTKTPPCSKAIPGSLGYVIKIFHFNRHVIKITQLLEAP